MEDLSFKDVEFIEDTKVSRTEPIPPLPYPPVPDRYLNLIFHEVINANSHSDVCQLWNSVFSLYWPLGGPLSIRQDQYVDVPSGNRVDVVLLEPDPCLAINPRQEFGERMMRPVRRWCIVVECKPAGSSWVAARRQLEKYFFDYIRTKNIQGHAYGLVAIGNEVDIFAWDDDQLQRLQHQDDSMMSKLHLAHHAPLVHHILENVIKVDIASGWVG